MKQLKFLASNAIAWSMVFTLFSCNSGEEKKTDEPVIDTTAATVVTEPVPAPVTKPSNLLIIMHKVANFAKWRPIFEANDSVQRSFGLHNYVLARGTKDSNMIMIVQRMDDAARAKEFAGSPDLKARMQKAGVIGMPSFTYLDMVMLDTTTIALPNRVLMSHKVKDWDIWKKEFDSHKQARLDAGLIDRAVGYSLGDNHNVTISFAISDMKKADEFMKSKDLKDKMTAAGVEGPPTSFYYTVVARY